MSFVLFFFVRLNCEMPLVWPLVAPYPQAHLFPNATGTHCSVVFRLLALPEQNYLWPDF